MRIVIVLAALALVPVAQASQSLRDANLRNVSLAVNANGKALVTYELSDGSVRQALVWGAINARSSSTEVPQVAFQIAYRSPAENLGRLSTRRFVNTCGTYDGPPLSFLITACKAQDGSYWAIQAWQRLLPMRGFAPWLPWQAKVEFHVSHWSGPVAELDVSQNWTYGGRWQGLFGNLTYAGQPVYGFKTPSATKRGDTYARYVYIDAHDSVYGAGWRHDAGKVLHLGDGAFCYSFVPQVPPAGYPIRTPRGPAVGDQHRVTVIGPGVTPDVQWIGPSLGAYDPDRDRAFNALFDRLVGPNDKVCVNER